MLRLPDDRLDGGFAGGDGEADRPLAFHYAPLGHPGVRDRMAAIARWAAEADPALLVVDVSVEVALLARLLAVPTIVAAARRPSDGPGPSRGVPIRRGAGGARFRRRSTRRARPTG